MTQTQTHLAEAGDVTTLREAAQAVVDAFNNDCVDGEPQYPDDPAYNLADKGRTKLTTGMVARLRSALAASPAPRAPEVPEELKLLRDAAAVGKLRVRCSDRLPDADQDAGMVWPIEVELPCINGLSCWFTIGNVYSPDAAARGYTDDALNDDLARAFADHIVRTLAAAPAAPPADGGTEGWQPGMPARNARYDMDGAYPAHGDAAYVQAVEQSSGATYLRFGPAKTHTYLAKMFDRVSAVPSRTPAGAAGDPVGEGYEATLEMLAEWLVSHGGIGTWAATSAARALLRRNDSPLHKALAPRPVSPAPAASAGRACTCHPDDNPPVPCAQQYALSECREVEAGRAVNAAVREAALAPAAQVNPGREEIARIVYVRMVSDCLVTPLACAEADWVAGRYPKNRTTAYAIADAILAARPGAEGDAGWQPIETAPKEQQPILLALHRGKHGDISRAPVVGYWRERQGWTGWDDPAQVPLSAVPTHWRPLPEPPAARPAPSPAKGGN
jgi:hypothetical protein